MSDHSMHYRPKYGNGLVGGRSNACGKRLSDGLLKEIESVAEDIVWSCSEHRKIHWVAWEKLCRSKKEGWLGFRRMQAFNVALLAKQGLRWRVGDGQNIRVWKDPWLPRPSTFLPVTSQSQFLPDLRVRDLLDQSNKCWNEGLIDGLFWLEDAELIKSIPLSHFLTSDTMVRYSLDHSQFNYFAVLCWQLWGRRNKFVMEKKFSLLMECVRYAEALIRDFQNVVATKPPPFSAGNKWEALAEGTIKANLDAAIFGDDRGCGV
ncbi:UNVERIFIED_CONTAM: putative mitochondrial protein [Sesamum latifolium]|uniref:Mitochondrial protein n=1 Tax=Sesamum latifolium TaxID=2727402 RepID=A0AAW2TQR7_9LAMI